jgi:hypothetical protein
MPGNHGGFVATVVDTISLEPRRHPASLNSRKPWRKKLSGWTKVFGPVLLYDMVRTARRRQFVEVRCLFALFLLLGLFCVWGLGVPREYLQLQALFSAQSISATRLAELNFQFFLTVTGLQLLAAFVLTPAYTGGAITQEKERKTLEFLLATDSSNREIVLSIKKRKAQVSCAIVMLALERYRRSKGRWPDSLAALAPAQLQAVPADPFDGAPLRYRKHPAGVVVYSIGPNRVDDGGDIANLDLGFRLWDPDKRRQLGSAKTKSE